MSKIQQRIACKALIIKDEKVLILREAPTYKDGTNIGRYHLPGGRIDPGEPFLEGLKREVYEETGLTVTVTAPLFVGEWFPVIREVKNQIVAIFFVCLAKDDHVRLSEEHDDYLWIDPKEYKKYDLMKPEDEVVQTYIEK